MASFVAMAPGLSVAASILKRIYEDCKQIKEARAVIRAHERLTTLLDQMRQSKQLPSNAMVEQFKVKVEGYQTFMDDYWRMNLIKRALKKSEMEKHLVELNEDIDMLFKALHLATMAADVDWKRRLREDMNSLIQTQTHGAVPCLVCSKMRLPREESSAFGDDIVEPFYQSEDDCDTDFTFPGNAIGSKLPQLSCPSMCSVEDIPMLSERSSRASSVDELRFVKNSDAARHRARTSVLELVFFVPLRVIPRTHARTTDVKDNGNGTL